MKKLLSLFIVSFWLSLSASAQQTTVTATITDSDSFVWQSARWQVSFRVNSAFPNINQYTINGQPLTSTSCASVVNNGASGTTNTSGQLSVTLCDNTAIQPAGSTWQFIIQSNTSAQAVSYVPVQVYGASYSLTTFLSSGATAPRFPANPGAYGYGDVELITVPNPGGMYYNTTTNVTRQWNGAAWGNLSGSTGVSQINSISGPFTFTGEVNCTGSNPATCVFSGGTVYPAAGVAVSTGSAWTTPLQVGIAANNLVQLNGSAALPVLSAANLINITAAALTGTASINTTGSAASATTAGSATNVGGGTTDSIPYQSGVGATGFIGAPSASDTYFLGWNPSGSPVAPNKFSLSTYLSSPPVIGGTTPSIVDATQVNIQGTGNPTLTNSNGAETWQGSAPSTGCGTTWPNGTIWHNLAGTAASSNRFYICDSATTTWNAKF